MMKSSDLFEKPKWQGNCLIDVVVVCVLMRVSLLHLATTPARSETCW